MRFIRQAIVATGLFASFAAWSGSFEDFFIAIRNDNPGKVSELLQRGFDPNTKDEKGQPALAIAMREQAPKTGKLLLDQPGIQVDQANAANETPLMLAAIKGDLPMMQMLLAKGAAVNRAGWAPLHYAASGPSTDAVKLLADRGADLNAPSPNNTTPLMMAAQYGSEDSVKLLLDRGAEPGRRNMKGLGAADFAKLAGRDNLAERLAKLPGR